MEDKKELLEKIFNETLNNINTNLLLFFKYYRKNFKFDEYICEILYTNPIFRNRKKLILLADIIKRTENHQKQKIKENKKKTEMYNMRIEEMKEIKNFIEENKKNLLNLENTNLLDSEKYNNDKMIEELNEQKNETKKEKENNIMNYFRECYCCKKNIVENNIHFFYSNLCKNCGDLNYSYRTMTLDLNGRIAIVTGGRIKIGFEIAKKLLSFGCKVIITTRFPKDALLKFKEDKEYNTWKNNLIIYPIDFRLFKSTIKFVNYILNNFPHLDILINNAAQTIRRPTSYYKYLLPIEAQNLSNEDENKIIKNEYNLINNEFKLNEEIHKNNNSLISLNDLKNSEVNSLPLSVYASQIKIMDEKEQPEKILMGNDKQPHDFTEGKNSWKLELDEVPFEEFMEVQIINAWTPYYLNCKFKPLMSKSPFKDRYIINVTAMEGVFNTFKRTTHPHTNMAKAALNMMTRTCGEYYKKFNIYMTAVDTGWVSSMGEINNLFNKDKNEFEETFCNVPLDNLDGAMRVLQPVIEGIKNNNYLYGIILKDYREYHW